MSSRWKSEALQCSTPRKKARSEKDKENQLLIKLNDLQEKLSSSRNDRNLLNEYYTLKAKLEKLSNKKIKGTILRSKARWYENGQKKILSTFST